MSIWYTTREEVKTSLDIKESARANAQIDRLIEAQTESIDGDMHRVFPPTLATRTFDWPNERQRGTPPWRLWLNQNELISITSMTSGGVTIPEADRFLRPDWGPPYTRLELDRDSDSVFGGGSTPQRDISITGLWGYRNDEETAGALAAAVASTSTTSITVSNASLIGVGQLLRIGTERMIVTGRSSTDTGTNLSGTIAASLAVTTVPVQSGAAVNVGEMILLDSERMVVDDITGNNLIVRRAQDGTVLAAHTTSDVYAQRTLTVQRGALGTTATTHLDAAAIVKWDPPALINQWARAETLNALQQEGSAYARVIGSGDNQREGTGQGLADVRTRARAAHGRKNRHRAV
jgi:hypothetical protein